MRGELEQLNPGSSDERFKAFRNKLGLLPSNTMDYLGSFAVAEDMDTMIQGQELTIPVMSLEVNLPAERYPIDLKKYNPYDPYYSFTLSYDPTSGHINRIIQDLRINEHFRAEIVYGDHLPVHDSGEIQVRVYYDNLRFNPEKFLGLNLPTNLFFGEIFEYDPDDKSGEHRRSRTRELEFKLVDESRLIVANPDILQVRQIREDETNGSYWIGRTKTVFDGKSQAELISCHTEGWRARMLDSQAGMEVKFSIPGEFNFRGKYELELMPNWLKSALSRRPRPMMPVIIDFDITDYSYFGSMR